MLLNFKTLYNTVIKSDLMKEGNYANVHQLPYLKKISVNVGVGGEVISNNKAVDNAINDLALITGQKPAYTLAKRSISSFKLRQGMKIGCKVTLRGAKMFHFLERLIMVALPRIRDFRGFSKKNFDGMGNISFGIKENIVFPEIDYDKVDKIRGMDITIVTSTSSLKESRILLSKFNLPFYD